MIRFFFRLFWRLVYLNPEYLRYSGSWDCRVGSDGWPVRLTDRDLILWVDSFRNQWFLYRHPELTD